MIYLNEHEPFVAQWCRNSFPEAEVDERDIQTISEPGNAIRQHYFAGLGGWEYALRLAGWPEDREVWTGSCPCQPFSAAGKGGGVEDERHLWPAFLRLIAIGKPPIIFGEQVNQAIQFGWLDGVFDSLEALRYACGAAVISAASVGAPHIRQRLYWVAYSEARGQRAAWDNGRGSGGTSRQAGHPECGSEAGGVAVAKLARRTQTSTRPEIDTRSEPEPGRGVAGGMEQSTRDGRQQGWSEPERRGTESRCTDGGLALSESREVGSTGLAWESSDPIYCTDGKWRRIPAEPGFQPLADDGRFGNPRANPDVSSRIGALKASGNAICVPLAAEFVRTVMETLGD